MKRKASSHAIDFSLSDLEESETEGATVTVERFSADRRRILQIQQDDIRFSASRSPSESPSDVVFHDLANIEPNLLRGSTRRKAPRKPRTQRVFLSDEPMKDWLPHQEEYLDEMFWHDGRAGARSTCPDCVTTAQETRNPAKYVCKDCFSSRMFCRGYMVLRHVENPFHRIQEWSDTHWAPIALQALGLRIQLGHLPHQPCSRPLPAHAQMAVVHTNGIHAVNMDYCGCTSTAVSRRQQLMRHRLYPATVRKPKTCITYMALETMHLQNVQSKCGIYDLYTSVERLSDNTGLVKVRHCYKAVFRCLRQWKLLKMCKRAGRGHDPTGIAGTPSGGLAVECPACPHPGINIPGDLSAMPEKDRWLYTLFTSIDACFRVKQYDISSEAKDPIIDDGLSYYVKNEPYHKELAKHGAQDEICSCTGLAALDHANTKFSKGYTATGIGACVCSRHEFLLKNAVGDLQKGEKYVNMDLIFCSAMRHHPDVDKLNSYDITCQWIIYLIDRISKYPAEYQVNLPDTAMLRWAIGKLHWYAHKQKGHSRYSLNWIPGVGRSDGEGIERRWWDIQPIASSVKMMGPGAHHTFLNDHWGYANWRKTVTLIHSLCRKLIRARFSAAAQEINFLSLSQGITYETQATWIKEVEDWEKDLSLPDPYYVERKGMTEVEIRCQLTEEEERAVSEGRQTMIHDVSAVSMLIIGLDLEDQQ
ncbi:hypothetical protein QCA50_021145 [Cerrena zonata]|uniref:CxC2-like cysteine cluster KDZ transposase-associated domain-containing protein n=1 Tax=Cerrena zonata TaxID=2478898 RepID=A0AAW0F831_9APHY